MSYGPDGELKYGEAAWGQLRFHVARKALKKNSATIACVKACVRAGLFPSPPLPPGGGIPPPPLRGAGGPLLPLGGREGDPS